MLGSKYLFPEYTTSDTISFWEAPHPKGSMDSQQYQRLMIQSPTHEPLKDKPDPNSSNCTLISFLALPYFFPYLILFSFFQDSLLLHRDLLFCDFSTYVVFLRDRTHFPGLNHHLHTVWIYVTGNGLIKKLTWIVR